MDLSSETATSAAGADSRQLARLNWRNLRGEWSDCTWSCLGGATDGKRARPRSCVVREGCTRPSSSYAISYAALEPLSQSASRVAFVCFARGAPPRTLAPPPPPLRHQCRGLRIVPANLKTPIPTAIICFVLFKPTLCQCSCVCQVHCSPAPLAAGHLCLTSRGEKTMVYAAFQIAMTVHYGSFARLWQWGPELLALMVGLCRDGAVVRGPICCARMFVTAKFMGKAVRKLNKPEMCTNAFDDDSITYVLVLLILPFLYTPRVSDPRGGDRVYRAPEGSPSKVLLPQP